MTGRRGTVPCYFCLVRRFPYSYLVVASSLGLLASAPAQAAQLEFVEPATWGANGVPNWVNMYIYVPDNIGDNAPILLVAQSCGNRSAPDFFVDQNVVTTRNQADANGYIVILPEHTGRNCFDSGSTESLTRDGGGDTQAFKQMVDYTLTRYNADPERVYVAGGSGGGMMTQAMLAVYPDVFKAGASRAGAPAGCWGESYDAGMQWSGPCAAGSVSKSAQEWGDLVRAKNPDYTGPYPRVMLFHASGDPTISYNNMGESIKEWTNVWGFPETPSSTESASTSMAMYSREEWVDACGYPVIEAWHYTGGDHSFPSYEWDTMLEFFGLHVPAGGLDPYDEACPDAGTTGGDDTDGGTDTGDVTAGTTGDDGGGTTGTTGGTTGTTGSNDTTGTSGTTGGTTSGSSVEESATSDAEDDSGGASEDEDEDEDEAEDEDEEESGEDSSDPSATAGGGGCACSVDDDSAPTALGTFAFGFALWGASRRRRSAKPARAGGR